MRKNKIQYYLPSLLLAFIIAYGSLKPSGTDSPLKLLNIEVSDKILHASFYFLLSISLLLPVLLHNIKIYAKELLILLMVFGYGLLMEGIQHLFIESRTGDFLDIIANAAGIMLAYFFYISGKKWHHYTQT